MHQLSHLKKRGAAHPKKGRTCITSDAIIKRQYAPMRRNENFSNRNLILFSYYFLRFRKKMMLKNSFIPHKDPLYLVEKATTSKKKRLLRALKKVFYFVIICDYQRHFIFFKIK